MHHMYDETPLERPKNSKPHKSSHSASNAKFNTHVYDSKIKPTLQVNKTQFRYIKRHAYTNYIVFLYNVVLIIFVLIGLPWCPIHACIVSSCSPDKGVGRWALCKQDPTIPTSTIYRNLTLSTPRPLRQTPSDTR